MKKNRKTRKKVTDKKSNVLESELNEKMLPQNIVSIGTSVRENKNIYIHQDVYKEIHNFTKDKTTNESGGILVGYIVEEFGKSNIIVDSFIEAKYCEATPTTLTFTHETWEYVHTEVEEKHSNGRIVGWIHTHPDFGIFLSEYDKFLHENFFKEEYQIAYVVDPIQNAEGMYFWLDGKLEKSGGFYVYDKTGCKIELPNDNESDNDNVNVAKSKGNKQNGVIVILILMVILLVFTLVYQRNQIKQLQFINQELINQLSVLQNMQLVVPDNEETSPQGNPEEGNSSTQASTS